MFFFDSNAHAERTRTNVLTKHGSSLHNFPDFRLTCRVLSERNTPHMLRAGAVRRLPASHVQRVALRLRTRSTLQPTRAKSIVRARAPQRFYAKGRAPQAPAAEADSDLPEAPPKSEEEEEKEKKQLVVPGPVPLSFWYTSDKEYIDENFMRIRDMYRISTFDLQEAVRLRAKEFELHLDEFKRRLRAPHLVEYLKHQQKGVAEFRPVRQAFFFFLAGIHRVLFKDAARGTK